MSDGECSLVFLRWILCGLTHVLYTFSRFVRVCVCAGTLKRKPLSRDMFINCLLLSHNITSIFFCDFFFIISFFLFLLRCVRVCSAVRSTCKQGYSFSTNDEVMHFVAFLHSIAFTADLGRLFRETQYTSLSHTILDKLEFYRIFTVSHTQR